MTARRIGLFLLCVGGAGACTTGSGAPPQAGDTSASATPADPNAVASSSAADPNSSHKGYDPNHVDVSQASPSAQASFKRATELLASDPNAALDLFTEAATDSPHFYAAQYNAACLLAAHGEFTKAVAAYRAALEACPDLAPAAVGLASVWQMMPGKSSGAEQVLRDYLETHPDDTSVRAALAGLLARSNRFDDAYREAVTVLHKDERNGPAMLALGMSYRRQKKYELAALALNQAVEVDPQSGEAYNELGLVLLAQDEKPKAVVAFGKAADASPMVAAIHNNLGVLQTEVGAFKAAVQSMQRATSLRPDRAEYYLNLGNALRGDQQYPAAEEAYLQALHAGNNDALYNLGVLYLDNDVKGKDPVARYQESLRYLHEYESKGANVGNDSAKVYEYLQTAQKALETEQKRIARDKSRKEKEAKEAAAKASSPSMSSSPTPVGASGSKASPAESKKAPSAAPTEAPPVPAAPATAPAPAPQVVKKAGAQPTAAQAQTDTAEDDSKPARGKGRFKGKFKGKLKGKFKGKGKRKKAQSDD